MFFISGVIVDMVCTSSTATFALSQYAPICHPLAPLHHTGITNNFFGLLDMSKKRLGEIKERGVTGNYKGDGFQLGGTFVIGPGEYIFSMCIRCMHSYKNVFF